MRHPKNGVVATKLLKCVHKLVKIYFVGITMKELYREIKINKHGLRFLPKLSLSGLAEVVYFYLLI